MEDFIEMIGTLVFALFVAIIGSACLASALYGLCGGPTKDALLYTDVTITDIKEIDGNIILTGETTADAEYNLEQGSPVSHLKVLRSAKGEVRLLLTGADNVSVINDNDYSAGYWCDYSAVSIPFVSQRYIVADGTFTVGDTVQFCRDNITGKISYSIKGDLASPDSALVLSN